MKLLIFVVLISGLFNLANSNNSTECYNMYLNGTINNYCFNTTACCFYSYNLNQKDEFKCIEKFNNTENICDQFKGLIAFHPTSEIKICNCHGGSLKLAITLLFLIIFN